MSIVRLLRRLNEERSQLIIMFVGIFSIVMIIGAITIDFGLWFSERQGVERAADLAALAGSQSLLRHASPAGSANRDSVDDNKQAIRDACLWAARNGYQDGVNDAVVGVQLFCRNTNSGFNQAGMCIKQNLSDPNPEPCSDTQYCPDILTGEDPSVLDEGCDTISVKVGTAGTQLFSSLFHIASSQIGFGSMGGETAQAVPIHAIMTIDRTGSMVGNPLVQAKLAATRFTDYLLASGTSSAQTLVGMVPYNECYAPPFTLTPNRPNTNTHCTLTSWIASLTNSATTVDGKIASLTADWGTNICLGLDQAKATMLAIPPTDPHTKQAIVLLSDGQNQYSNDSYNLSLNAPPPECRPTDPAHTDPQTGNGCFPAQPNQRNLDRETNELVNGASGLKKALGVEVYVVGFGVCGTSVTDPNYSAPCIPGMIDSDTPDISANRNLLKCLASSKPGTNDHYYEVPNASDLPNIFQDIAWAITGRSLTQ